MQPLLRWYITLCYRRYITNRYKRYIYPAIIYDYPKQLRRVECYDEELKKNFIFLTNAMDITAFEVALLYKIRWSVELFFYDKHIIMQSKSDCYIIKMLVA